MFDIINSPCKVAALHYMKMEFGSDVKRVNAKFINETLHFVHIFCNKCKKF